ncbi:hypothetical protein SAMN05192555_12113 [Franzmannia pantelleriensis]|uniref:Uncharacterized protein n=1 Tax=Franzmannia pantelleriensis TaxID=48727 RepID=A0A1G9WF25_9GAMM|nr:hypothetical protein [Halomonas pantelleriensis]SDM83162.1 hypothetical protein SAMN05192555_12113 [Halomonas pantelleriensis]
MTYNANPCKGPTLSLQVCDATSGSVRLAWRHPRQAPLSEEDQILLALKREEAVHDLVRRHFLLTTERYLKSDLGALQG